VVWKAGSVLAVLVTSVVAIGHLHLPVDLPARRAEHRVVHGPRCGGAPLPRPGRGTFGTTVRSGAAAEFAAVARATGAGPGQEASADLLAEGDAGTAGASSFTPASLPRLLR
jgi:hypothetical protein